MGNIKLSIIIPLYNKENCITDTIQSVLSQSFKDYEIIVVDDGSTDHSADKVSEIQDDRIQLLRKKNEGVSKARNYGAREAKNNWLIFLDGDDCFLPGALSLFADLISRYPNDEVFISNYYSVKGDIKKGFLGKRERIYDKPIKGFWYKKFYPHPGNTLCSKAAFCKLGGFDERMSYYEDLEFGLRLLMTYRIVYSPQATMEYIENNNEARIKLHPIQKEFSYYTSSLSTENRYVKYYLYERMLYFIKRRLKGGDSQGAAYLQNLINEKYSRLDKVVYFFYHVRRHFIIHYGI